ncbi:MAG: RloB family protein [Bryobacteraceae bacterium]
MKRRRAPESDSLRRRGPRREPKPRILIVCEGRVTEPEYFRYLERSERIPIELEIVPAGVPKAVVEKAANRKKHAAKSSDPNDRFDQVWCVFDIDEHPNVNEAKAQARANGIGLVISNPCIELWLLLHFQDQRAAIHRRKVQKLCRNHMPGYEKGPPCEVLFAKYPDAEKRAADLNRWHETRGTSGANPSTNVHDAVRAIRVAGRR